MRAAFVDELLASEIADEQAWIQRGVSLNYDLTRPHAAWMVEAKNIPEWPTPLLRFVSDQGINAPFSRRDEGIFTRSRALLNGGALHTQPAIGLLAARLDLSSIGVTDWPR